MNMKRKILALTLCLTTAFGLFGCGNDDEGSRDSNSGDSSIINGGNNNGSNISTDGFIHVTDTILVPQTDAGTYAIVYNDTVLSESFEENISDREDSLDGSIGTILTDESLYVVTENRITPVAQDVKKAALSSFGDGIVYITPSSSEDYYVNHYDIQTGRATLCGEVQNHIQIAISPDGDTVVYASEEAVMLWQNNQSVKICDDQYKLIGVSNAAAQIYLINSEGILYSFDRNGNRTKLGASDGHISDITLNADHSQILFYYEDKSYISTDGQEAQILRGGKMQIILPNTCYYGGSTCPVTDFYGHAYYGDDKAWLIQQDSEDSCKLISKASYPRLDASSNYLYYIYDGEELRCIKISDGDKASEKCKTIVNDDITGSFFVTSDRSLVYYLDRDKLLCCSGKKAGASNEICDDVTHPYCMGKDDTLYFRINDDLYACSDGENYKKIGNDIEGVFADLSGRVYCYSDDSLYYVENATLHKLLDLP
ncbi:MAG: hypothetical protein IJV82_00440 [Oscillospiraceae bacterium]|nr:hypothetical protein [Oscillospiraceae bacterium]